MKTLIINGSPRPKGDTQNLLSRLRPMLEGEIVQVDAYRDNIHACIDCRACWKTPGCAVKDAVAAGEIPESRHAGYCAMYAVLKEKKAWK